MTLGGLFRKHIKNLIDERVMTDINNPICANMSLQILVRIISQERLILDGALPLSH